MSATNQIKATVDKTAESFRDKVIRKCSESIEMKEKFFSKYAESLETMSRTMAERFQQGAKLFVMGNGGSLCDALHICVEFNHPIIEKRPAFPVIPLMTDIATMTAIGNDVGFDHIFVRQIIAQGRPGDSLIGISTSGNSANLVKAFRKAKEIGLRTIGLTGNTGGEMARIGLDHCLIVETDSIHRIQECHVAIYHILWDLVHTLLADERGNLNIRAAE